MKNYFFCDFMVMKLFFVWFFYSENEICPVLSASRETHTVFIFTGSSEAF